MTFRCLRVTAIVSREASWLFGMLLAAAILGGYYGAGPLRAMSVFYVLPLTWLFVATGTVSLVAGTVNDLLVVTAKARRHYRSSSRYVSVVSGVSPTSDTPDSATPSAAST
jgi:hypothetical protein